MVRKEVVVVGGGTIGNFIAYHLAKSGIDVLVSEDNKQIGRPQHCSGLVSIKGLERIGTWNHIKKAGIIDNEIRAARFIDYSGSKIRVISFEHPVAVVIDRIEYDNLLYGLARDSGAEYWLGSRTDDIAEEGLSKINKNHSQIIVKSDVIVDAEGAKRRLLRKFVNTKQKGLLPALQMDILAKKPALIQDTVELYFNVNDFFSWIIPISPDKPLYRVGVASKEILDHYSFVKSLARKKFGKFLEKRKFGGIVVSSGPVHKYVFGKILVVGDAAGHVKPTTGGGIVLGSLGAYVASKIIKSHLDKGKSLVKYQNYYEKILSSHYKLMKFVRNTLNLFGVAGAHIALSLIPQVIFDNIKSDMDLQTEAILKVVFPFANFLIRKKTNS